MFRRHKTTCDLKSKKGCTKTGLLYELQTEKVEAVLTEDLNFFNFLIGRRKPKTTMSKSKLKKRKNCL